MFQPDNNTVSSSLPTPSPAGTPGYFTNGNPVTGTPATMVDADWLNMITMELINVAKKAGITPDKANYGQLAQSIEKLAGDYAVDAYTKPEADARFIQSYPTPPTEKHGNIIDVELYGRMRWSNKHSLYQSTSNIFELADSIGIMSNWLWADGSKVPLANYMSLYTKALDRKLIVEIAKWKPGQPFFAVDGDQLQLPYIGDDFLRLCGDPTKIFEHQEGTWIKAHVMDWVGNTPVGGSAGGGLWHSNVDELWERTGMNSENPPGATSSIGGGIKENANTGCITGSSSNSLHSITNGNTWIKPRPNALRWAIRINI